MTDQTHCREFTAAEVEVEAAYIGQFHSEQAARTRDMLEAYARILRNTRAQASAPEGGAVAWQVRHREKTLGYWMGWGQCQSEEEARALVARYAELSIEAEWRALFTRSNAKAGEVDDYKKIARLIGHIFFYGSFKAETANERDLESLLRKTGNFPQTQKEADEHALSTQRDDGSEMGVGNG